jgi:uncharacterized protein YdaU (DUF1376 family)
MPWYKRCPVDWRAGTRSCSMTMELRGFYSECLDAMWELQGPLPKDAKALAMLLGSNPRQVRALMAKLVDLGKMVETDKDFRNSRMLADIFQGQENVESISNGAPIDRQSVSKIRKNSANSTRDLEADTEAEIEKNKTSPSVLVATQEAGGQSPIYSDLKKAFNGTTDAMLDMIEATMGLGTRPNAERWLSSTIAAHGQSAVAQAFAILIEKKAAGQAMANPLAQWSKTAGTLKANRPTYQSNSPAKRSLRDALREAETAGAA